LRGVASDRRCGDWLEGGRKWLIGGSLNIVKILWQIYARFDVVRSLNH